MILIMSAAYHVSSALHLSPIFYIYFFFFNVVLFLIFQYSFVTSLFLKIIFSRFSYLYSYVLPMPNVTNTFYKDHMSCPHPTPLYEHIIKKYVQFFYESIHHCIAV